VTLSITVRLDSPVLRTSVERAPEVDATLEQETMTSDGTVDLTLWGSGGNLSAFEDGLDADETVSHWVPVGGTDTRKLYRTRLTEEASPYMHYNEWADGKAVFLSASREPRGWTMDAYLHDRSVLQEFAEGCESNGVQFDLLRVSEVDQLQDTQQFGLSEVQAETLLTAFEEGYYSVPREINLEELADPLDVSHQAVSERLRRGVRSLIETTVADQWHEEEAQTNANVESGSVGAPSQETTLERPIAPDLNAP
jgi:hypothetical protein